VSSSSIVQLRMIRSSSNPLNRSLQTVYKTPSDPDATYDGHKGQGYQVQIMETYSNEKTEDKDSESLQLITYVDVEPAHCHDSKALEPALEDTEKRGQLPDELGADTSYGGQSNKKKAKEYKVDLISPTPGRKPTNNLVDFEFDPSTHVVTRCPKGHSPVKVKHNKKGTITGIWTEKTCRDCPLLSSCSVKKCKTNYRLLYTHKAAESSFHRRYEQSAEFKDKYRFRSGIEATNSRYIHMTGARRLRYRGLKRIDYAARLKALGINMFRAATFMASQKEKPCFV